MHAFPHYFSLNLFLTINHQVLLPMQYSQFILCFIPLSKGGFR